MTAAEHGGECIVPWWSFTKTVIAAAALTLVQDGWLRLDDTIDGQPYTLRQLLQHRAGLADYGTLPEYHAAVTSWRSAMVCAGASGSCSEYPISLDGPGMGWRYSNIGYLLVRQLIERQTDTGLDAALRRLVLDWLGSTMCGLRRSLPISQASRWVRHRATIRDGSITACWSVPCGAQPCCSIDCS